MVGRGNHHRVHRLVIQHLAEVADRVIGVYASFHLVTAFAVWVADVGDLSVGESGESSGKTAALATTADHAQHDPVVGSGRVDRSAPVQCSQARGTQTRFF